MRLKGINPLELHVEKAVVGVVGAVALGILAWQFVGPSNRVMVKNQPVELDEAYKRLDTEAQSVLQKIRSPAPELADIPQLDMLARWESRMQVAHTPSSPLPWPAGGSIVADVPTNIVQLAELKVDDLTAPAPTKPVAATYLATIAPEERDAYPELANLLPPTIPYDHAAVSVESTFSGTALRQMLVSAQIPEHWYSNGIAVVDVLLEREELHSGEWTGLTVVPPMPGRESLRADLAAADTPAKVRPLLEEAPQLAEDICRPAYYQIVFGEPWTQPSRLGDGRQTGDRGRIDSLLRQREHIQSQIERLESELGKTPESERAKRRNLEDRINRFKQDLDRNRDDLVNAGYVFPDKPDAAAPEASSAAESLPLLAQEAMTFWAHDLTAQRGKTYRYRFVLALRNPLYGQGAALHRDSKQLAERPVMLSRPSEWSDPVRVDPDLYFFITAARDPSRDQRNIINSTPSASAEIYAFHWGYWRRATISLEPGDPLVGELRVPDMAKILEAARQTEQPAESANQPSQTSRPPEIPWKRMTVVQDGTFLLDVAAVPVVQGAGLGSGTGVQYRAFFRDADGNIVVRTPDTERADPAYQRVVASAEAGEDALRPREVRAPGPRQERQRPGERPTGVDGGKGPAGGG
jgi:hypothetical protein